jgi:D-alanyl-D-alanine carboxypeptidase (penicillin-binding protein 5/6)
MKKYSLRLLGALLVLSTLCAALSPLAAAAGESTGSAILDEMQVKAKAAILVDTAYDEVLYQYNAHEKMYPASITKVMTCMLTLEAVDAGQLTLEQVVTASSSLHTGIGDNASTADIKEGEQIRVIDLLYAALIPSANEACNVLAEAVAGSVADFVTLMNTRAAELGMEDTHFANTHGYHDDNHYTSAYDVYLMCRQAMKNETFRTIVASKGYTMPATNLHTEPRDVHSTNALISNWNVRNYLYEYATGIKTGSTNEAGYCLAASATKEDRTLISVVMGCEREPGTTGSDGRTDFSETIRLLEWGFDNFSRQVILDDTALNIAEMPVTLSKSEAVALRPEGELAATLPKDLDPALFTRTPTLSAQSVEAPVEEGQVLGSVTVSYNGVEYGTLDLVALNSVERSDLMYYMDRIEKFFNQLWVKILLVVILIAIVALILRRVLLGSRRGRRRGRPVYSGRSHYTGSRRRRR